MHDIGVASRRDHRLGGLAFATGIDRRPLDGLGRADRRVGRVELAREAEPILRPQAVDDAQPLRGAGVAIVMLVELQPILARLVGPPARHDVEGQAPPGDPVDIGRRLGEQRGMVEVRTYRDHQLQPLGHRGQRGGGRPGVERGLLDPLDVVEVEFRDQRQVISPALGILRECLGIGPARVHALVGNVAQPAAEHRHPESVAHQRASSIQPTIRSTSRSCGSQPSTSRGLATKFDSALTS